MRARGMSEMLALLRVACEVDQCASRTPSQSSNAHKKPDCPSLYQTEALLRTRCPLAMTGSPVAIASSTTFGIPSMRCWRSDTARADIVPEAVHVEASRARTPAPAKPRSPHVSEIGSATVHRRDNMILKTLRYSAREHPRGPHRKGVAHSFVPAIARPPKHSKYAVVSCCCPQGRTPAHPG